MSEQTVDGVAGTAVVNAELWSPGASIITLLIASVVLFLFASAALLVGACALTVLIDLPH